jgi:hypothetical protein
VLITVNLATDAASALTSTPAQVAAAINANATAAALVTATASNPGSATPVPAAAAAPLSTGTRSAAVSMLFSEALQAPALAPIVTVPGVGQVYTGGLAAGVSFGLDLNGNGFADVAAPAAVFAGLAADGVTVATNLTTGLVTVAFDLGVGQTATVGTSQIRVAGVRDVAGNAMTPTARAVAAIPAP